MEKTVSIHIVAWNSMAYLPDLLRSIFAQTYTDFQVLIIDNASTDGMETFVREQYPQVTILRNPKNLGFAPAHNQGIRYALEHWSEENHKERFILFTNPDTIWTPTYLENLMKETERFPDAGSFGGKLLRAFGENLHDEVLKETVESDLIDSTGLAAYKNRTFADRGAGEKDEGQYDAERDVFGLSGALVLYRASVLRALRHGEEYFDQDFFAYKEDVDMAWRAQLLGFKARFVPDAVAYHYRGMYGKDKTGFLELLKNRRGKSKTRNYYSTRNHWNLLMKNELFLNGLISSPRILVTECGRFCYVALFEPQSLKGLFEALARMPKMLRKRGLTLRERKASAKEMRAWFR